MTYNDPWKALSARIQGLMQAAQLHARFLAVRRSDPHRRAKRLGKQVEDVLSLLQTFRDSYQGMLPSAAVDSIDYSIEKMGSLLSQTGGSPDDQQERVWAALVQLGAFETELSFILSDIQQLIRSRAERAFSHLQRSIVADPAFGEKWRTAP